MKTIPRGAGLLAAAAAIILLRSHDAFLHPIASAEDATQGINYYAHAGTGVFHFYAGYVSALPNMVDFAAMHLLRLPWVPGAQAVFALLAAASLAPALDGFFRHGLGWPYRCSRPLAVLVATLPVGDVLLVSNTEFSIWSLLGVLLLTLFNPVPETRGGLALAFGWRALVAASNPLSVIAIPVWCVRAVAEGQSRQRALFHLLLAAWTTSYAAFGVVHGSLPRLTWGVVDNALSLAVDRSLLALLVRGVLRINLHDLPSAASLLVLVLAGVLMALVHGHGRKDRWRGGVEVAFLVYCIVALAGLCALGRQADGAADFVLISPRYQMLPRLFWAVVLAMTLVDVVRRWSLSRLAQMILVTTSLIGVGLIWQKGMKVYASRNAAQAHVVYDFLVAAEDAIPLHPADPPRLARQDTSGDWSIVIDRRKLGSGS